MKSRMRMFCAAVTMAAAIMTVAPSNAQEAAASVPVRMTVTASVPNDKRMPELSQQDIAVTQGKERLKVMEWVAAKGDRAGLDLFILIDDASNSTLGMHFDDLKRSSMLSRRRLRSASDTCETPQFRSHRISPRTTPQLPKPCGYPWRQSALTGVLTSR